MAEKAVHKVVVDINARVATFDPNPERKYFLDKRCNPPRKVIKPLAPEQWAYLLVVDPNKKIVPRTGDVITVCDCICDCECDCDCNCDCSICNCNGADCACDCACDCFCDCDCYCDCDCDCDCSCDCDCLCE